MSKKIAVIGSGIAGLAVSYLLNKNHDVHLYEKNEYFGGHTNTISIKDQDNTALNIDTGFIVFNSKNYPVFLNMLTNLNIPYIKSDMSFSYNNPEKKLTYCGGRNIYSLLGKLSNIFNYSHLNFLFQIKRISRKMLEDQAQGITIGKTLYEYLNEQKTPTQVINDYFLPMGAAIWSSEIKQINDFPVDSYITFFNNHGLLFNKKNPVWYSISNGSQSYVRKIISTLDNKAQKSTEILKVTRSSKDVSLHLNNGNIEKFDLVVIATHANDSLKLLENPTEQEKMLLSKWKYSKNNVVLHSYTKFLPKNKYLWASWNFLKHGVEDNAPSTITYNMNRLQSLNTNSSYFVTLNPHIEIPSEYVLYKTQYTHPIFDNSAINTQKYLPSLNGVQNIYYCGSYFGYGFHEDAINSAIKVVEEIDGTYEF